ncbi:unnamed protein product [Phytophthora fragariaefolia]|uniref:Unnamed protein product n=1 Tax=Phytophthora fragariaefolia TaxID=1490495 RepID=A0A9W6YNY9_9STRA|nr:unnamed protein product [Phytophthora fragariaefolia]
MRTTPRNSSDDRILNGSQSRTSGAGVRRKRHGERLVHARIQAVYNDVGRSAFPVKQESAHFNTKSKSIQDAEIHDEYYRLLDAESELKSVCLQEQQKRVKAVAHVRRLEEIIAMKDKKIDALLHANAVGADRTLSTSKSVIKREMAERDRQFHVLAQRLRQKIAQQSQLLSSYEEAMQSLRSGIKSTNLMELEEERSQLYQELRRHQELLCRQRLDWEAHQQKLTAFAEAEASNKLQIAKLQQENKIIAHEKRKLEQEVCFFKSQVEMLQNNLAREQRKRTYDREFSESVAKHTSSSPTQKVMLAQALEEMKKLMRREAISSIRREKLKSPKTDTIPHRPDKFSSLNVSQTAPALKTSSRATIALPMPPRPSSAVSNRLTGTSARIDNINAAVPSPAHTLQASASQDKFGNLPSGVNDVQTKTTSRTESVEPQAHRSNGESQTNTGIAYDKSDTNMQERSESGSSISNPEPDPGGGQPSREIDAVQVARDQVVEEEIEAMQQQALAAAQSVLRFDADDDDSELSADLLDDAQHPMLRSDTRSAIELADAVLAPPKIMAEEAPPDIRGQSPQTLDDLYPSDFLDTDAQACVDDEDEVEPTREA